MLLPHRHSRSLPRDASIIPISQDVFTTSIDTARYTPTETHVTRPSSGNVSSPQLVAGSKNDFILYGAHDQKHIHERLDASRISTLLRDDLSHSNESVSLTNDDESAKSSTKRNFHGKKRTRRNTKTQSPFANIGKSSAEKAPRSSFLPTSYDVDEKKYPTYICPRCKTRQREFFTVDNAAGRLEGPGSYLALYFAVYVTCSLFIFGLEEGWKPLDCIYFAVVTLTTAGLGDFVPTSSLNKIICSIFIYFGVACIGLLLGSYIAGMLDDRARRDRKDKQVESCPNCARLRTINDAAIARNKAQLKASIKFSSSKHLSDKTGRLASRRFNSTAFASTSPLNNTSVTGQEQPSDIENATKHFGIWDSETIRSVPSPIVSNASVNSRLLGSPITREILGRQKHTRHASIDVNKSTIFEGGIPTTYGTTTMKNRSDEAISRRTIANMNRSSSTNKLRSIASSENFLDGTTTESEDESSALSSTTISSTEAIWDASKSQLNAAKYVFVTLRLALFNSMLIIAVGCVGFWLIEGFPLVDSWYFTTVLLTTVGYGDIVPVTNGGKLFTTIYILVAGTLLLHNMSSISMIPLELRRRRIERTILTQFGDHLDDAALRELATGPLVQRLRLSANRTDGLDECTREMFSLAMLVRLGKVTEHDIRGTFSCFRHLDVNNEGVLNSKSIIAGMIAKKMQSNSNRFALHEPPPPPPLLPSSADEIAGETDKEMTQFWFGRKGSLHINTVEKGYVFHGPMVDDAIGLPSDDDSQDKFK